MVTTFTKEQKELLDQKIIAIVSVLTTKGYPHMTPVWFVEHEGKIYFSTETSRVKGKLLAKNNKLGINITHPSGGPYVSIQGNAIIRTKDGYPNYLLIHRLLFTKYVEEAKVEQRIEESLKVKDRVIIEIEPVKVIYPKE